MRSTSDVLTHLKRFGTPEGIAARVLYMTAPEIRFRVWCLLILDGGMATAPRATFELTDRLEVQMNRNTGK